MGFKITIRTTAANETFTFPMNSGGGTVNCVIDWGDSSQDNIGAYNDPLLTHEYAIAGDYDIEIISGTWTAPYFNNAGDKDKVIEWKEFGTGYGTNWSSAFYGCSNMVSSAIGAFGASIQRLDFAFTACSSLLVLDVSGWDVSSVSNFSSCFFNCSSLTTLDVSNWNVSSVTTITNCFYRCSSLLALDVSNWSVSIITNFSGCFRECSSLTTLDVSNWNVSSVNNFSSCFFSCSSLETLNVSNWNVSSVTNFANCFYNCSSLTALDVSSWNVSLAGDLSSCFYDCSSLATLDVSNWDVSSVTILASCFRNCSSLKTLDVSGWDVSSVTNANFMFNGSGFTSQAYDALLSQWSLLILQNGVSFHAGSAKYSLPDEKAVLVDTYGWSITDGGLANAEYLLDGFCWFENGNGVFISDLVNTVSVADLNPNKVGIVYGDGVMRLTIDGVQSAEVPYRGELLVGTLDILKGTGNAKSIRKLQRYSGTKSDLEAKIAELMT